MFFTRHGRPWSNLTLGDNHYLRTSGARVHSAILVVRVTSQRLLNCDVMIAPFATRTANIMNFHPWSQALVYIDPRAPRFPLVNTVTRSLHERQSSEPRPAAARNQTCAVGSQSVATHHPVCASAAARQQSRSPQNVMLRQSARSFRIRWWIQRKG